MRLIRVASAAAVLVLLLASPAAAGLPVADLAVTNLDLPDPVGAGATLTYNIGLQNNGPQAATNVSVSDTLPAGVTFVSVTTPVGWTATTPPVGGTGTVTWTNPSFGLATTAFVITVQVGAGVPHGTIITDTATASATSADPVPGNNSATTTSTVVVPPTPAASNLPNAAMPGPQTGSPLAVLGFGALLASVLATTAVLNRRRYRSE